jgi:succinate dehydrogenase / fumarate reductase cytochrome b subunit
MTSYAIQNVRKFSWKYVGHLAYFVQRATGLALLFYLFLHVHTIHMLRDPKTFDAALDQFRSPFFKLLEIGLMGTVILHALNGIRLTMVDVGVGLTKQRQVFWWFAVGVGAVIFIAGAIPILMHTVFRS